MKGPMASFEGRLLLHEPLDTPVLVHLEKGKEVGVALRVGELFSFRRKGIPVCIRPVGWQGKEGIWVVALVFRMLKGRNTPWEAGAYLNPRKKGGLEILRYLTKQERLPFFFLTPDLRTMIRREVLWSSGQRQEVRRLLLQIEHSATTPLLEEGEDREFEEAKGQFQRLYSVQALLATQGQRTTRIVCPFRGAVLD